MIIEVEERFCKAAEQFLGVLENLDRRPSGTRRFMRSNRARGRACVG
jgi:hypothetical protein